MRARILIRVVVPAMLVAAVAIDYAAAWQDEKVKGGESPRLAENVISPVVPKDIEGGAPKADLTTASVFAWREFIALNWPVKTQDGRVPRRDEPDIGKPFGNPGETGPLVWHTYRSKVEIFPGTGAQNTVGSPPTYFPPGYVNDPSQSFGYDAPPQYVYNPTEVKTKDGTIPPCNPNQAGDPTPWINLDETTQIGLDAMYVGLKVDNPGPNTDPQRIRFMAKANRSEYIYVVQNNYWWKSQDYIDAQTNLTTAIAFDNYKYPNAPFFSLRDGTIEVKAAWRPLSKSENPGRFYTTKVRYYNASGSTPYCYWDEIWALVALHIIQKTPTAPYFIFATFEQADNILTPDGQSVEDDDGTVIRRPVEGQPTTPSLTYMDSPTSPTVTANGPFCGDGKDRLNYQELPGHPGLPTGGRICVNYRDEAIPKPVIAVNRAFHQVIRQYAKAHGFTDSPWLHYKLVNVQWVPFDASSIDAKNPDGDHSSATYHLANIVVETDYTLQQFNGRISALRGAPTSYPAPPNNSAPLFKNTFIIPTKGTAGQPIQAFNMGGCMGCHGQGNSKTDFSFILAGGPVASPETATPEQQAQIVQRYLRLFAR